MIRGIGLDICRISRMEEAISRPRFLERFFSEEERAYVRSRGNCAPQTAAGLFAAKEAFLKALGTGIDTLALADIGITHDEKGAPRYRLTGRYADLASAAWLSITHDADVAAAVCVLEEAACQQEPAAPAGA